MKPPQFVPGRDRALLPADGHLIRGFSGLIVSRSPSEAVSLECGAPPNENRGRLAARVVNQLWLPWVGSQRPRMVGVHGPGSSEQSILLSV